jgi:hypothetical protein
LRTSEILEASDSVKKAYRQYLLSTLESDFFENRHKDCDLVLIEIEKLENGELNNFSFEFDFINFPIVLFGTKLKEAFSSGSKFWNKWVFLHAYRITKIPDSILTI